MFSDGEKVNNVAVSISGVDGEAWIAEVMPSIYHEHFLKKVK